MLGYCELRFVCGGEAEMEGVFGCDFVDDGAEESFCGECGVFRSLGQY